MQIYFIKTKAYVQLLLFTITDICGAKYIQTHCKYQADEIQNAARRKRTAMTLGHCLNVDLHTEHVCNW